MLPFFELGPQTPRPPELRICDQPLPRKAVTNCVPKQEKIDTTFWTLFRAVLGVKIEPKSITPPAFFKVIVGYFIKFASSFGGSWASSGGPCWPRIYVSIFLYIYIYIYICTYTHIYLYIYVYLYKYSTHTAFCTRTCICETTHMYICI